MFQKKLRIAEHIIKSIIITEHTVKRMVYFAFHVERSSFTIFQILKKATRKVFRKLFQNENAEHSNDVSSSIKINK
jgi:hypothetical protein